MAEPTTPGTGPIDWDGLRDAAITAAGRAYAPYSKFPVGAAAITDAGDLITGCNVENVSYGLTLCAECGLVSALHDRSPGTRLVAVVTVSGSGKPCSPCGRCRQLLLEHGGPDCVIDCDGTVRTVGDLLPYGFDADRLAQG